MPDRQAPVQGLLEHITAHALDEDYASAARSGGSPRRRRPGVTVAVILAGFGLLLITSGAQTSRNAVAVQASRDELVTQIDARALKVEAIRARIVETRRDVARLETRFLETTSRGREISTRLTRLGTRTGLVAVEGPGVRVEVDDAPNATGAQQEVLDEDLQKLVNALWASGAEAISVNGQRLTNLSAIRHAGSAITVNYRSLSRPYVVLAIGDPNAIPARFVETRHGAQWLDLQATFGLQFAMTPEESLTLPAATRLDLRVATSASGPR